MVDGVLEGGLGRLLWRIGGYMYIYIYTYTYVHIVYARVHTHVFMHDMLCVRVCVHTQERVTRQRHHDMMTA